jgi:putative RNA 2'-phosphotransferase
MLSHVLRHAPDRLAITIDPAGWADVPELIAKARKAGFRIDMEILRSVVEADGKGRFTLAPDGSRIRAAQGHSIPVDLGLDPSEPPAILYHGTARHSLDAIFAAGLIPGSRRHVHLSADVETAAKVGSRHGSPVVLTVDCSALQAEGFLFWQADNGVWLTDHVPAAHLGFAPLEPGMQPG